MHAIGGVLIAVIVKNTTRMPLLSSMHIHETQWLFKIQFFKGKHASVILDAHIGSCTATVPQHD